MDFSARFDASIGQPYCLDTNGNNVAIGYGNLGATSSLTKLGLGTLTINGANTYTGFTAINAGTVLVNNPSALGSGGAISFGGGILQYGDTSHSDSDYNNADFSTRFSTAANQFYSINTNGHSIVYTTGLTSSGGSLMKLGSGTLTLNGASTYTGATTVSAGALVAADTSGSATGTGPVTVQSGGTLGGSGTVMGALTVDRGGTLDPGLSLAPARLTLGSRLALNAGATLTMEIGGTTPGSGYSQVRLAGALSLVGSNLRVVELVGFNLAVGQTFVLLDNTSTSVTPPETFANTTAGSFYTDAAGNTFLINYAAIADGDLIANDVTLTVASVVPEPDTWVLLGLGGAALLGLKLRRRAACR